jgi:proteic killer suppression protein
MLAMIKTFRHSGLKRLYETGSVAGLRLHPLKGRQKGRWSVWVSANWRLTFEFFDGHVYVLDYEDYH